MQRAITCTLTNQPIVDPVLCIKSGFVYEKYSIKKYLELNQNKCPNTGMELNFGDDFIPMKATPGPKFSEGQKSMLLD